MSCVCQTCLGATSGLSAEPVAGSDDERKAIGAFSKKLMDMVSAASSLAVASVADKTGLFKLLADAGKPLSVAEISALGQYHERYVTEVCSTLACAEFLAYDKESDKFHLPTAQAKLLADPKFPLSMGGWLELVPTLYYAISGVSDAMMKPDETTGVPYSSFSEWGFASSMDRLNGPGIATAYVRKWLPALPGGVDELKSGIHVADLGCGEGRLALTLAEAFPKSTFVGVDVDPSSIARAKEHLAAKNLTNVSFTCCDMAEMDAGTFDLCVNHDCIHDLVDPVGVLATVRRALKPNGRFFSMEPKVKDTLAENLNPMMAQQYAISTLHCMTVSLAHGGVGLGSGTFGPRSYEEVARSAGFTKFSVVGSNVINNFFELKGGTGASAL